MLPPVIMVEAHPALHGAAVLTVQTMLALLVPCWRIMLLHHVAANNSACSGCLDLLQCWQGLVFASPRVNENNMSRDHSHGNIHVHNRPDDSAHASALPAGDMKPEDGTMV